MPSSSVNPAARASARDELSGAQADDHPGRAAQRVAQVLRLGAALRPPPDHADLADALEGLRQHAEQVPAAAHDRLLAVGDGDVLLLEDGRLEVQILL